MNVHQVTIVSLTIETVSTVDQTFKVVSNRNWGNLEALKISRGKTQERIGKTIRPKDNHLSLGHLWFKMFGGYPRRNANRTLFHC